MRRISFTLKAYTDYLLWLETDKKLFSKISTLIVETSRNPFSGTGKPEPLKNNLNGCWSRRINEEHRLIYRITDDTIEIISCRYHYSIP
jgi:toxin YoeB